MGKINKRIYREPSGLKEGGDIFKKPILKMTNKEVLRELAIIFGHPVVPPSEKIGWIANTAADYMDGNIVNVKKLIGLYDRGKLVPAYIATLALTSLRNRSADLFTLIRQQKPGNIILDYGCGTGTHGIACAQQGGEVHLMDVSSAMRNVSTERFRRRGLEYTMYECDRSLPSTKFDTIICTDVLEHVPDPGAVLQTFLRVLKPHGILHLLVSPTINPVKGHLAQAIQWWGKHGNAFMTEHFKKLTKNNYRRL